MEGYQTAFLQIISYDTLDVHHCLVLPVIKKRFWVYKVRLFRGASEMRTGTWKLHSPWNKLQIIYLTSTFTLKLFSKDKNVGQWSVIKKSL